MFQTVEVQAGATGAATRFEFYMLNASTGQLDATPTEANTTIEWSREGDAAWTAIDDANAENILESRGNGKFRFQAIAAPFAAAAGVGYVDFLFRGTGFLDTPVRVYLRPYDWRAAPLAAGDVETALADNISAVPTAVMTELAGTGGATARTAIATAVDGAVADNFAAIAASVDSALTDNFAALPAAIVTALLSAADGQAWGVQSTPSGGSSVVWPVRRGGTLIGNRTLHYSSAGAVVGWTAVA